MLPFLKRDIKDLEGRPPIARLKESAQFNIWNLVKRPHTANPYQLTAKYRVPSRPTRRVKSGIINRRRKGNVSRESRDRTLSVTTSTDVTLCDLELPDDFDYDADVETDTSRHQTPQSVYSHSQLTYLRACGDMKVVPTNYILKNLTSDHLVLKHHVLGQKGTKACSVALVENSTVQVLDLEDNAIGIEGAKYIAEMLEENNFITELRLAENNLGREGVKAILDVITESDCIRVLDFSGNNLQEMDAGIFTKIIEDSHNLKELYLNHNSFREKGGMVIGEALGWNDTLEVLDLSWNHLRLHGATAIAKSLAINDGIKALNISWNGFYLDGCKELAKAIEKNSTLEELDIGSNRINKLCLTELLKGLKKNDSLKVLKLYQNPITSSGALYLLKNIKEDTSCGLHEIDLGDQCVEPEFVRLYEELRATRDVIFKHGWVLGQDGGDQDEEEELVNENPVIILMEFGKLMGLRLIDLFSMMDKDNSKTLTRDEIKHGLLEANIPLTEKCLDKLVQKLDTDGDGEIDYAELMAGKEIHRRKLTQTIMMSRDQSLAMEETEVGRVRERLLKLTAKHRKRGMRSGFSSISGMQMKDGKVVDSLQLPTLKASERRKSIPRLHD